MKFLERKYIMCVKNEEWRKAKVLGNFIKVWSSFDSDKLTDEYSLRLLALELSAYRNDVDSVNHLVEVTGSYSDIDILNSIIRTLETDAVDVFKVLINYSVKMKNFYTLRNEHLSNDNIDFFTDLFSVREFYTTIALFNSEEILKYLVEELYVDIEEYIPEMLTASDSVYAYDVYKYLMSIRHYNF